MARRPEIPHGFTVPSLIKKRTDENFSFLALSCNLFLPFSQTLDQQLKDALDDGEEEAPTREDVVRMLKNAAVAASQHFFGIVVRVGIQTAMACVLIERNTSMSNSIVLHWDLYPRMHFKYVGDLLRALYLPKFIASFLGPQPSDADVEFFSHPISPTAAFEDSLKRNIVVMTSEVVVNSALLLSTLFGKKSKEERNAKRAECKFGIVHSAVSLGTKAIGAATGYLIFKSGVGEYWGEHVGTLVGTIVTGLVMKRKA